jgi:thiamine-phosphate pyrophosphorylase
VSEDQDSSTRQHRQSQCRWGLYVILDSKTAGLSHIETARHVIAGGAKVIQLRDKESTFEDLLEIGKALRALTSESDVTLIVNDNPYLAREINADGVHIGQDDFPADIVRDVIGPDKIVGLSTHTKQQAIAAMTLPVDYIGFGPIFRTSSKVSEWKAVGTASLEWVRKHVSLPITAVGGITEDTIGDVIGAGADNIAVIRAILASPDIAATTARFVEAVETALGN